MSKKARMNLYGLAYWFFIVEIILTAIAALIVLIGLIGASHVDAAGNKGAYFLVYLLAFIFSLISYAWVIPMTLTTKNIYRTIDTPEEKSHMALGICAFIFAGVVSGVLIMVASNGYRVNKDM